MRSHLNPVNSLKTHRIFREPQDCPLFCSAFSLNSDKRRRIEPSVADVGFLNAGLWFRVPAEVPDHAAPQLGASG